MKLILSILMLIMLIGMAGAAWYPQSQNLTTTGDVNANDGVFSGSLSVTGVVTASGGTVNGNIYDGDFRLAANHGFYSTTGSGGLNFANATGMFNTSTGTNYLNGNIIQASGKNITQQGAATFTSGTGAVDINGAMTSKGITLDAGYDIIQSGDGYVAVGTGGVQAASPASPLYLVGDPRVEGDLGVDDNLTVDNVAYLGGYTQINSARINTTLGVGGGLSLDGYLYGNGASKLKSLGINDTLNVDNAVNLGGLTKTQTFQVNGTSTLTGVTTIGLTNQTSAYIRSNTTLLSATVKPFYWLKPADAHTGLTVTLPPAAEMNNATLEFSTDIAVTNSCQITLDGSGSETINGATTKYATALYSSIRIKSDGIGWHILSSSLTWT